MFRSLTHRIAKRVLALTGAALLATMLAGNAGQVEVAYADTLAVPAEARVSAEAQLLNAVNADRAAHGLAPLAVDAELTEIARWRSDDMVARSYFSHDIGGYQVFSVIKERGIDYRLAGENLAYNYDPLDKTASEAEAALMGSPAHRSNILRADYSHIGLGMAMGADGRIVFTQLFKSAW